MRTLDDDDSTGAGTPQCSHLQVVVWRWAKWTEAALAGSAARARAPRSEPRAQSLAAAYAAPSCTHLSASLPSRDAPSARAALPPPLPPEGAMAAASHSLAEQPFSTAAGGASASAVSAPLLTPTSSTACGRESQGAGGAGGAASQSRERGRAAAAREPRGARCIRVAARGPCRARRP